MRTFLLASATAAMFGWRRFSRTADARVHADPAMSRRHPFSNQNMGFWNVFVTTTLKLTGTNYYVLGSCP